MNVKKYLSKVEMVKATLEQTAKDLAAVLGVPVEGTDLRFSVHSVRFEPAPNLLLAVLAAGGRMDDNNGSHWVKVEAGRGSLTVFFKDEGAESDDYIPDNILYLDDYALESAL